MRDRNAEEERRADEILKKQKSNTFKWEKEDNCIYIYQRECKILETVDLLSVVMENSRAEFLGRNINFG